MQGAAGKAIRKNIKLRNADSSIISCVNRLINCVLDIKKHTFLNDSP